MFVASGQTIYLVSRSDVAEHVVEGSEGQVTHAVVSPATRPLRVRLRDTGVLATAEGLLTFGQAAFLVLRVVVRVRHMQDT